MYVEKKVLSYHTVSAADTQQNWRARLYEFRVALILPIAIMGAFTIALGLWAMSLPNTSMGDRLYCVGMICLVLLIVTVVNVLSIGATPDRLVSDIDERNAEILAEFGAE
jgi:hypothetical protein